MRLPLLLALLPLSASAQDQVPIRRLNTAAGGLNAMTRVVVLPGSRAVYWDGGVKEAKVPASATTPEGRAGGGFKLVAEEARLTLELARAFDRGGAPAYSSFLKSLASRWECLEKHADKIEPVWPKFKKNFDAELAYDAADKPASLARYQRLIFSVLDPSAGGKPLSATTMLVPLSPQWLKSTPALAAYFKKEFLEGGFDTRIVGGDSGEGLTDSADRGPSSFFAYKRRLLELKALVATDASASSPEGRWLAALDESSFDAIKRLIFIHERTWDLEDSGRRWAGYIAIDQSFGELRSRGVLSVLIHEINVNSFAPQFLPGDTHYDQELSRAAWATAAKGTPDLSDPEKRRAFFGLNPFLGTIYLGYYADRLAIAAPSCR